MKWIPQVRQKLLGFIIYKKTHIWGETSYSLPSEKWEANQTDIPRTYDGVKAIKDLSSEDDVEMLLDCKQKACSIF